MSIRLILIGPPGVGKGTQAALLEERLGALPISSGVIFRSEIDAETDLGRLAKSYIDRGELVAFIVEKSQNLSNDNDFVLAMDRLIQFANHMRQRERLAQVKG